MHISTDLPELVTLEGVYIHDGIPSEAKLLEVLVKEYPQLWINQGLIDIPKVELVKIPLVEG
jgi:hypothetical protein